jgi:predicted DNA-binding transcriptional regulator AlpA
MTIQERIAEAKRAEMLTVEQVALLTQYDPQTIYRKAKKGQIPGMVRYGRGIRFVRIVVLQWDKVRDQMRAPAL